MIKSTFILANILSVLFMAGALAAFTAQPAASQTAKKLKCRGCVKSKQIGNNQIRGSDIKDGEIGLGDLGFNPATQEELDNTDTLSDLTCADGEVPKMVGGAWTCAADADSAGDISLLLTKIDNLARLQASGASA